jgi:hypothetical protein
MNRGTLTRRRLLQAGAGALAVGAVGPLNEALAAAATDRWPSRALGSSAARRIDASQFLSQRQLARWVAELDDRGLRATASPAHDRYVDVLLDRLERAGVGDLHVEPVPLRRWLAKEWKLDVLGGPQAGPARVASYIPFTGPTTAAGVAGPLALLDSTKSVAPGSLSGRIAVFDVELPALTYGSFVGVTYPGATYDPKGTLTPDGVYRRPWLNQGQVIEALAKAHAAGAVGAIAILDLPKDAALGSYFPYDSVHRPVPGLFVDRSTGAKLKELAAGGVRARLTLTADVGRARSRNVIGTIRGASKELVVLQSHTDGTNALEDNGPDAIVAMAQYLARLPRRSLPRSVLVVLSTGHFYGGRGTSAFAERHRDDALGKRIVGALSLEHLGALEWNPLPDGGSSALTGLAEAGTVFAPNITPLVEGSLRALKLAKADRSSVLRDYVPNDRSPDGGGWPADGVGLWADGHFPTANYIAGPTYLLNWGVPTVDKIDVGRMRRQAMAFTRMVIELGGVSREALATVNP